MVTAADSVGRKIDYAAGVLGNIKRSAMKTGPIANNNAVGLINIKLTESFIAG